MNAPGNGFRRVSRNGLYSVVDYLLPQFALLLAAPLLLKYLGLGQLGLWMLSTAATTGGVLAASCFGDAAIKYISERRSRQQTTEIGTLIRGTLALNLSFAFLIAVSTWAAAPALSHHIAHLSTSLVPVCTAALRVGAGSILVRAQEAAYVSTLRAMQRYDIAALITSSIRSASLLLSVLFARAGSGVLVMLSISLILSIVSVSLLCLAVRKLVGIWVVAPYAKREILSALVGFSSFSWLQTMSALAFNQLDRILVGLLLGPAAVAIYGICVQTAQPIHALTSAAFHGLFPYVSSRALYGPTAELRRIFLFSFATNVALSTTLSLCVILSARPILSLWLGPIIAKQTWPILSVLAIGFGLLSINITGYYSLLGLGRVRAVATLNILAAAVVLALMPPLARHFGLIGIACARLVYGPITYCTYIVLRFAVRPQAQGDISVPARSILENL